MLLYNPPYEATLSVAPCLSVCVCLTRASHLLDIGVS